MNKLLLSIYFAFIVLLGFSQDIPERQNPPKLVNDFANVINDQDEAQFEAELVNFSDQTSTQITVVTVPSLNGNEISDFAFKLGEKWGVGQKGKNNGIVIVFKPKIGNEKGQIFVAVGYGLEGVIPDAIANRVVVDNEMIPRFKVDDIYGGLYAGTKVLMGLAAGEFTADAYQKKAKEESKDPLGGLFFVILIVIVIVSIFKGGKGGQYNSRGSLPFWLAMGLLSSGRGGGSFGNFSGGGSGGGGFGGFGGGSFGGGGAGGSW